MNKDPHINNILMEFSIYDDIEKLKIIEHSQVINNTLLNGEEFEDKKLEEGYQKHLASLPKKSVYVICLLQLVFYCSNIFYSNISDNNYASVAYTSFLAFAIASHSVFLLILICSDSKFKTRIKACKVFIFLIFLTFGIFNLIAIYLSDIKSKESIITKNFYLIAVIVYFSYSLLIPNSKLSIFCVCFALTTTIVTIELYNVYKDNNKPAFTQEIVSNCCCVLSYYLNNENKISKRNSYLSKENIKKLFYYYESMVSSLTHQVVCFSEEKIVYENNSFREKILNFIKTVSRDDQQILTKVSILQSKNDHTESNIPLINLHNSSDHNYPNINTEKDEINSPTKIKKELELQDREFSLINNMRKNRNMTINNDKLEQLDPDDENKYVRNSKLRSTILELPNINQSYLLVQLYMNNFYLTNKQKRYKLSEVINGIYTAFTHGKSFIYHDGTVYNPCTSFSTLGIFEIRLLECKEESKVVLIHGADSSHKEYMEKTSYFEVSFRSFPLQDSSSFILDVVFNDITKVKQAEKEGIENKLKHTLFSKIAHEFKTPLTSIIAINDQVKEKLINREFDSINSHMIDINNLSNYTIFLINDIIQYSSNDNSKIKIQQEIVNLKDVCNFCFNIQNCLVNSKSGKYSKVKNIFEFDEDINEYELVSDEIRLKQILLNLISNSVKFTKSGHIKLRAELVSADDYDASHDRESNNSSFQFCVDRAIKLSISDTGVGLKPEELKKIASKYDDGLIVLDTDKEYNKLGSGLGLHIVQTICGLMKIKLKIWSEYGKGSTFSIFLSASSIKSKSILEDSIDNFPNDYIIPLCQTVKSLNCSARSVKRSEIKYNISTISPAVKSPSMQVPRPKTIHNLHEELKYKILIVDDNKTIRKSYINILQSFSIILTNYDLIEYEDGIDLIKGIVEDQHQSNLIKAVFTDENMEYINGSEAIKILRELERNSKIKRCLYFSITAFEDDQNKQKILDSGADLILSKPASRRQLEEVIEFYFSTKAN